MNDEQNLEQALDQVVSQADEQNGVNLEVPPAELIAPAPQELPAEPVQPEEVQPAAQPAQAEQTAQVLEQHFSFFADIKNLLIELAKAVVITEVGAFINKEQGHIQLKDLLELAQK